MSSWDADAKKLKAYVIVTVFPGSGQHSYTGGSILVEFAEFVKIKQFSGFSKINYFSSEVMI